MSPFPGGAARSAAGRVICPKCGAEMNCHAEKVDWSAAPEVTAPDEAFGGVLVEFHTCPGCRAVVELPAER